MPKIKTNKIKNTYKGFQLEVSRELSISGETKIFYNIMRMSDSWFLDDGCSELTSLREVMGELKLTVDEYIDDPASFED